MKNKRQAAAGALVALTLGLGAATPAAAVETIIFIRHGEKRRLASASFHAADSTAPWPCLE